MPEVSVQGWEGDIAVGERHGANKLHWLRKWVNMLVLDREVVAEKEGIVVW